MVSSKEPEASENKTSDQRKSMVTVSERIAGQLELFPQLIAVEQQRIEAQNRRTDAIRLWIEKQSESDKRMYDYQMAKLTGDNDDRKSRFLVGGKLVIGTAAFCAVLLLGLFGFIFLGSVEQRNAALEILAIVGIAIGGAGGYVLLERFVQSAMRSKPQR